MRSLLLTLPLIVGLLLLYGGNAYCAIVLQDPGGVMFDDIFTIAISQGIGLLLVVWFIWPKAGGWAQMIESIRDINRSHHEDMGKIETDLGTIKTSTQTNHQILNNIQTQLTTRPCMCDKEQLK